MLPVHYRPPETLPGHHRDFPPRDPSGSGPSFPAKSHNRVPQSLIPMVVGYLLAMIGGIVLLNLLTPVTGAHTPKDAGGAIVRR